MIQIFLNQPFVTTYFALAGFLIAAGVFFDRLAGEPLKTKVAAYLRNNASFDMNLTEYTRFFVAGSITKFFHGNILTARNFLKSLLIALASLTFVILLYAVKNNQNPLEFLNFIDHDDPYLHALGLGLVFGAVVLGDIFSILQTALFLNLVGSIRSAYDVIFLLFCDLIITINIFVFTLPIGLQWVTVANDFYGSDIVFAVQTPKSVDKTDLDQVADEALRTLLVDGFFQSATVYAVGRSIQPATKEHTVPEQAFVLYKGLDPAQVVRDMMRELGTNVRDVPKLELLPEDEPLISRFFDQPHIVADVHLSSYMTNQGRVGNYGWMFIKSRIAQNVFPLVATLQPVDLQMGDVYTREREWLQIPHKVAKNYFVKCDNKSEFADKVPNMQNCATAAVIGLASALMSTYEWNYFSRPFIKDIPITPLAFSCLFLTFAFYALMMLSFVMIKIVSALHFLTFTYRYIDIDKSTFFSVATFTCVFIAPLFAVAFLFYAIILRN